MGSPFVQAAGFSLSHLDKLVLATRDLIAGDPQLSAWCEGRVFRDNPLAVPVAGRTAPWISVCPASEQTAFKIGCSEKTFKVSTVLVYEVGTTELADDEASESAVSQQWEGLVVKNGKLLVPRFGNNWLARRVTLIDAPDWFVPDLASGAQRVYQILTATYESGWNNQTWQPEA